MVDGSVATTAATACSTSTKVRVAEDRSTGGTGAADNC